MSKLRCEKHVYGEGRRSWVEKEYYTSFGNMQKYICYFKNGNIQSICFYDLDEATHREDNRPAYIEYYSTGELKREAYYLHGGYHRTDGPAIITYNKNGTIKSEYYCLFDSYVDQNIILNPKDQSVEDINNENFIEVKRARIELFGWDRYLKAINAKVLEYRHNDIDNCDECLVSGSSKSKDAWSADKFTVLICACCSTARVYFIEVPPRTKTCEQAQKYLLGRRHRKARMIGAS